MNLDAISRPLKEVKYLNYLLIFLFIICLLVASSSAQKKKKRSTRSSAPAPGIELIAIVDEHMPEVWKELRSDDGGFSVLLPGKPKETTQVQTFQQQQFTTHLFQLLSPNAEYEVSYVEFPVRVDEPEKIQGTLDGIRMDSIEKDNGRLLKESPLYIAGRPGRYISWRSDKGTIWQAKYFPAGYRIYMLSFGVADENNIPEEIQNFRNSIASKFFDSFKLLSTKNGSRKGQL